MCYLLWAGWADALGSNLIKHQSPVTRCADILPRYRVYSGVENWAVFYVCSGHLSFFFFFSFRLRFPRSSSAERKAPSPVVSVFLVVFFFLSKNFLSCSCFGHARLFSLTVWLCPSKVFDMAEEEHEIILQKVQESKVRRCFGPTLCASLFLLSTCIYFQWKVTVVTWVSCI